MGKRSRKGGIPGIEMRLGMNKFERVHLDIKERDEKRRQRREKPCIIIPLFDKI